ncbi:MAG: hypothetical protein ABJH72_15335 [Reichenbachiella sp.]|uniref:hypothetical protein n=1 Tax=Reichenbachiella sp. TaxID=2184521 RepID=UPI003266D0D8
MTNINSRISLIVLSFLVMYSCKTVKNNKEDAKVNTAIEGVVEAIGGINETLVNDANTLTLYIHVEERQGRTKTLNYVVMENKSGNIVHNDKHAAGYVKWFDDYRLEVLKSTEMLQPGEKLASHVLVVDIRNQNVVLKSKIESLDQR